MDKVAHVTNMASVSNLQWKDTLDSLSNDFLVFKGRILKQPPLKSSGLHTVVLKCNCRIYDDNISLILKYPSFPLLGA